MNKVKITIGKTEYKFHFGLWFFGALKENQGLGMEELQAQLEKSPLELVPVLMLEAAKTADRRMGIKVDYKEFHFLDAIDDDGGITSPAFAEFLDAFTSSMVKDVPKEPAKKKVIPKRKRK